MVRLKALVNIATTENVSQFQFQYGAIKSANFNTKINSISRFQFQYGAIKSKITLVEIRQFLWFQFQYGAIKSSNLVV